MDSSAPRLSGSHALSLTTIASKLAPTKDRVTSKPVKEPKKKPAGRLALALALLWLLIFLPHREAEWRFCAVGNPAWMPG
jgi:hypothetical protein